MTEPRAAPRREPVFDVVDAEFETVGAEPRGRRETGSAPAVQAPAIGDASPGMDMLRNGATPPADARAAPAGPLFWGAGAVLAAMAFWVAGGHTLAESLLRRDSDAGQFRIADLRSRVDDSGPAPLLVIDGAVANGGAAGAVPPLRIEVRSDDGRTTRYMLRSGAARLAAGETWRFSSRVSPPAGGVAGVLVTVEEGGE